MHKKRRWFHHRPSLRLLLPISWVPRHIGKMSPNIAIIYLYFTEKGEKTYHIPIYIVRRMFVV